MAYTIEVPVGDGEETVRVEVREAPDGMVRVARPGQVVARATRSLDEMLDTVRPVAQSFVDRFRDLVHRPDEINLQFGLNFSAEADALIASTAAEASFTVSLTWHAPAVEPQAADSRPGPVS